MAAFRVSDIDSGRDRFSYLIRSPEDLPADFPIAPSDHTFQAGLFLPRDDPDWFGRSKFPPRILLHGSRELTVLTHPAANVKALRLPFRDIVFCEAGHLKLIGWLRFVTTHLDVRLPYNTRATLPAAEFLESLMCAYLSPRLDCDDIEHGSAQPSLDIKFEKKLRNALGAGERIMASWFSPSRELWRGRGPFRFRPSKPGDLLAITGRRLLWITDRWNGRYARYGSLTWSIPLQREQAERARDFAQELGIYLSCQQHSQARTWKETSLLDKHAPTAPALLPLMR